MRRQKNILSRALTVPAPGGAGIGPQLLARCTGILQPPQPFEAALLLVMEFAHYEEAPQPVAEKVIAEHQKHKAAE